MQVKVDATDTEVENIKTKQGRNSSSSNHQVLLLGQHLPKRTHDEIACLLLDTMASSPTTHLSTLSDQFAQ